MTTDALKMLTLGKQQMCIFPDVCQMVPLFVGKCESVSGCVCTDVCKKVITLVDVISQSDKFDKFWQIVFESFRSFQTR